MSLRMRSVYLLALVMTASITTVPAKAAGDPHRGKQLAYTCLGCHGIDTYKNVYPTYSVPKLRGQHPDYIVSALQEYAKGERSHATMHAQASSLSDQDMQDIAAYFSGEQVKSSGKEAVGEPPAVIQTLCKSCHGMDGVGIADIYPTLSGQHADYIEQALQSYRSGSRKSALMQQPAQQLKPEEIKEIAEYFSKQQPALKTVPRIENLSAAAK